MGQSIRLFWRTARLEILIGVAVSITYSVVALTLAARLQQLVVAACGAPPPCPSMAYLTPAWISLDGTLADPLMFAASGLPLVFGLLFGPALVAGELERGRMPLVWSLTSSRLRWLLWRAAPVALLVAILAVAPALAASRLESVHAAALDPARSFHDFGSQGPLLVIRSLAVFALGVAAGAYLGRVVPALLVTAGLSLALLGGAAAVRVDWLPRQVVPRDVVNEDTPEEPLPIGEGFRLPDGRLLTFDESASLRPASAQLIDSPSYTSWLATSGWQRVFIGIRGFEVSAVEFREGAVTVLVALGALILALVVVARRRPSAGLTLDRAVQRPIAARTIAPSRAPPRRSRSGAWLAIRMATNVGRAELLGALTASVIVSGLAGATVLALDQDRVIGRCTTTACVGPAGAAFNATLGFVDAWLNPALAMLPFAVGAALGAPLVAREFESGSGRLAWALSGDRTHWLFWRLAPVLALAIVLLIPVTFVSQALWQQSTLLDPWSTLPYYWLRGPTLIARAVAMFGTALLVGAVMRRVLPALIVSALAAAVLYNALAIAVSAPLWATPVAIPITTPALQVGSIPVGPGVAEVATDGSWQLDADLRREHGFPSVGDDGAYLAWLGAHGYQDANLLIPGSSYWEVVGKESIVLVGEGLIAIAVAAGVLRNSRLG
jgi:hypothetical protein